MRRYVEDASRIIEQLDTPRKLQPPRNYGGRKDDFAWLDQPERPARKYNSALSSPGRLCPNELCKEFVAGKPKTCPHCQVVL